MKKGLRIALGVIAAVLVLLVAGGGVALIGITLIPLLSGLLG